MAERMLDLDKLGVGIRDANSTEEENLFSHTSLSSYFQHEKLMPTITARSVTLAMLITDGILEAGNRLLSIKYLGRRFVADLLPNGKIKQSDTGELFNTPSAWATHCKKIVNPTQRAGCGWSAVKCKGKKLDMWKSAWFRKHRPHSPFTSPGLSPRSENGFGVSHNMTPLPARHENSMTVLTPHSEGSRRGLDMKRFETPLDLTPKPAHSSTPVSNGNNSKEKSLTEKLDPSHQAEALNLSLKEPKIEDGEANNNGKDRSSVHYSVLTNRSPDVDINTLVDCESFKTLGKRQPFTVSIATNSLLLMDFHSHMTTSEVVGYLGGKWDASTQHLSIIQSFPCHCRLGDAGRAVTIEEEIRHSMTRNGLSLVGWYHSHPYSQPDPSMKDVDCQMSYQLRMKGAGSMYYPCVGMIIAPYEKKSSIKMESSFLMFMVMPPLEDHPADCGIPMKVKYSSKQNPSVSEELLSEMKNVADFYRTSPDWVKFKQPWLPSMTYLEKIKTSLSCELPEDQMENGTFLDFVDHLLTQK